ncbi:MAG: nitrous oxide reductase accessory protein NosL [Elusimicrobia bacterium]|nr:nitrous oxide reductase accessory protein NosL [Elusimicrobiota bacterium]
MKRLLPLVLLLGCATPKPGQPPDIAFGRQECARCGMIVSEERFAAGYVADDGEAMAFDDLGELLAAVEERPELRDRAWARDLHGSGWLRLADARLVRVAGLTTPMGTGWVAFAKPADAEAFVQARARR